LSERDRTYLAHILECIERIESYTSGTKQSFLDDVKAQDATIRNLQVLAESTKRLSAETKALRDDVDWSAIAGLRNVLVHDYLEVDLDQLWTAVTRDLPRGRGARCHCGPHLASRGRAE
jgi:uncharacterized protein with HEPN domain